MVFEMNMSDNWAGAIFKYYPRRVADDFLYDSGIVPDQDFVSNLESGRPLPVWAICVIDHRLRLLSKSGMVFFVPARTRWSETELDNYICTGIFVSKEKIARSEDFVKDPRFTKQYLEGYRIELPHKRDKPERAELRRQNIVIGDSVRSVWFGRNAVRLDELLNLLGLRWQAWNLHLRNTSIPRLTQQESERLYVELVGRIGQGTASETYSHPPPSPPFEDMQLSDCGCIEDEALES